MVEVGFGQRDITPSIGSPLSGFISRQNQPSTAVDAPLLVRCLAFREQEQLYFLLSYDLVGIPAPIEQNILNCLEHNLKTRFVRAACILVATHNHSGPVLGLLCGEPAPDPTYIDLLADRSLQAVGLAVDSLQPAHMFVTERRLPGLTYNRRTLLADGRVSISPQPDAPVIERGPLDDRLTLLLWRSLDGKNLAGLIHFACHGVAVLSQAIGSDIPGGMAVQIGNLLGAPCLFLQGASGDVNPTTVTASRTDLLNWIEQALGHLDSLAASFRPARLTDIQTATSQLPLYFAPLPDQDKAVQDLSRMRRITQGDITSLDLAETIRSFKNTMNIRPEEQLEQHTARFVAQALVESGQKTLTAIQLGQPLPPQILKINLWRLGDYVFVFLAGEIFSVTGTRIRALSKKLTLLPVSYMAPLVGYLPDQKAIQQGGYEVDDAWRFYGHPAPFASDSEQRLVAEVENLLNLFRTKGL